MSLQELLPLLIPLLVVQLVLIALALWDLMKPERRVRGNNKLVWAIIIVVGELIGPLIYFFFGREDA